MKHFKEPSPKKTADKHNEPIWLAIIAIVVLGINLLNTHKELATQRDINSTQASSINELESQVEQLINENQELQIEIEYLESEILDLSFSDLSSNYVSIPSVAQTCGSLPSISLYQQSKTEFDKAMTAYTACTAEYFNTYN